MTISTSFQIIICRRFNFNSELFLVVYLAPFSVFLCSYFVVFYTLFSCFFLKKFNDNDFIKAGLGGMGYSCTSYKKTISNCKFIRGQFQTENS
jgi:hypothetical protein